MSDSYNTSPQRAMMIRSTRSRSASSAGTSVPLRRRAGAHLGEPAAAAPLKVAVYDVAPYGAVEPDGSIDGVSVDLWRRAAEALGREYASFPVVEMEAVLDGVARNDFDAAIGAITVAPERLARSISAIPRIARASRSRSGRTADRWRPSPHYGAVVAELAR